MVKYQTHRSVQNIPKAQQTHVLVFSKGLIWESNKKLDAS